MPVTQAVAPKPSPSPMRGASSDPFAALDSQNVQVRSAAADELAARFPSLDEFSLLHDRGAKFDFAPPPSADPVPEPLNKRVTEALADDAFGFPISTTDPAPTAKPTNIASANVTRPSSSKSKPYEGTKDPARSSSTSVIHQPTPQRPNMVSTGIQTSPAPSPAPPKYPDVNQRPVWRVPSPKNHHRSLSQTGMKDQQSSKLSSKPELTLPPRPSLLESHRSKSQTATLTIPRSPASSRPSLESQRPSALDIGDAIGRSKSANSRPRPTSVHVSSNLEYLRDRELSARSSNPPDTSKPLPSAAPLDSDSEIDGNRITSNVEFLRSMESDESQNHKSHRRSSSQSKHSKRSSLPTISLSHTKSIVKGKFGDAFRRFESNSKDEPTTPQDQLIDRSGTNLTPIAGSEATGGASDDERAIDETEDLPPEVRRELERRRLSQEEKRVAEAAAEYRRRLAEQGDGGKGKAGPTRASTIQNRVKELLDDSKHVTTTRTAEGYGKYTDEQKELPPRPEEVSRRPLISRKPITKPSTAVQMSPRPSPAQFIPPTSSSSAPPMVYRTGPPSSSNRPSAPPKPKALRTGGGQFDTSSGKLSPIIKDKPLPVPATNDDGTEDFDVNSFSKRYPSLSGIEMVETEIGYASGNKTGSKMTVKDV